MYKSTLLLLALFLSTTYINAQDQLGHFRIENREIIWQKVFHTDHSFSELQYAISTSLLFEDIVVADSLITGKIEHFYLEDGKKRSWLEVNYIDNKYVDMYVSIEYRAQRYRVTVKRILEHSVYVDSCNYTLVKKRIEENAIRGTKEVFTNDFSFGKVNVMELCFTNKFDFNKSSLKDEW
ncbi:hypothetical protein [Labilibacter marinus]|uniref:hypothetical protein n=1 Tax=Labilibacter marinus TaxID=1477105 RepID=UPI00082EDA15|nr:hypothetical protein [Labilibacter marinus]